MIVDVQAWIAALAGGGLIGGAAVLLMAAQGRIAGISGIAAGAIDPPTPMEDRGWRLAFVAGLILAPVLLLPTGLVAMPQVTPALPLLIAGGLLVGFGTQLGSGCTSGHGICGLARLSPRSLVSVLTFMGVAGVTVFVVRHVIGG
jgi:uncharacterized membrane protein YedE/YeeE